MMPAPWDYLILTATNDLQAAAYESQLEMRRSLGQFSRVGHIWVVPDLEGRRIGSGGSTIECLRRVISQELRAGAARSAREILAGLRILIVHAGGDSRRLPAYSPCGKIFVPLPGTHYSAVGSTIFDRLVPQFLSLPDGGEGQVIVASGDALLTMNAPSLTLNRPGLTALGGFAEPEEAARHGVYCATSDGRVRLYLQKPGIEAQHAAGAVNRLGQAVLDLGVMSMDAEAAAALVAMCCKTGESHTSLEWIANIKEAVLENGIDLYREVCCALGTEGSYQHYVREVRRSGGKMSEAILTAFYEHLKHLTLNLHLVEEASFLHFGSTRQLISSGVGLLTRDTAQMPASSALSINNYISEDGAIEGTESWIEGCKLLAPLRLGGRNVITGVEVVSPLTVPAGDCIDVSQGTNREGDEVRFVRCYGVDDTFKHALDKAATFCNLPMTEWMNAAGAKPDDLWASDVPALERTLWNARVFPAVPASGDLEPYRDWMWFFDLQRATAEDKARFLSADRYSAAEIAMLVDQPAFHGRRATTRAQEIERAIPALFSLKSSFSHRDLAFALERSSRPAQMFASLLTLAHDRFDPGQSPNAGGTPDFEFCRIAHCLGSALGHLEQELGSAPSFLFSGLAAHLSHETQTWLNASGLPVPEEPVMNAPAGPGPQGTLKLAETATETEIAGWAARLQDLAFEQIHKSILRTSLRKVQRPRNALRPDETIWGRSPARLELAGGWTDTPPYTLEHGGDVANTAINLSGQPPIHCYCRITNDPVIRLNSIDGGQRLEIRDLEELLDYRRPGDPFALGKAALAISGFSPDMGDWPSGITLDRMLSEFGGGIELTTLVGIPQGSGLGTSSILGATILGVIARMLGLEMTQQELFHNVLRLEQALTTGGGWQDQVGGCVGGSKITSTRPGVFPEAHIHYLPSDVLDPKANGGCTLLYYTGLTRIAKGILGEIVGGYLNREPAILDALAEEHEAARQMAHAMGSKDIAGFGACLDAAWELQKRLCHTVTNPAIESLLNKVRPYVHGMRISGAGSGGFLLMVAQSPAHAVRIRELLDQQPLNERSRFFDFEVNEKGLEVTTC